MEICNKEVCSIKQHCGGCIYQGVDYAEQVELKGESVKKLLEEKKLKTGEYIGIEGSPKIYNYRNKMEYTFGNLVKDGEMTLGMHKRGQFMSIITVDECQLVDDDFNIILRAILNFCNEKGYKHYHKRSHRGLLRNLVIRKGERTKELLINIVTSTESEFDDDAFVKMLLDLKLDNEIVGILHTYNDNLADSVVCERLDVLYGRDYYNEKIMGLQFKVSAFSFFQTNISAVERLYTEALDMIDDVEGKTVFDLYCGTGTITQSLAVRAKKVVGVEIVEDAVLAARDNAKLNGLDNCEFIAGDVLKVLDDITDKPDVIVVDPPRAGMNHKVLPKLLNYGVDQILYISCNPKTMVDNLRFMEENGYRVVKIKAFDNFPFTKHVETVVLLSKGEVDSKKIRVEFSLEDMDMSEFQDGATYPQIKAYVLEHSGLKVSNLYISQVKRKCGIEVGKNYNLPKSEDSRQPQCPPEKEKAIREAFKYFGMI
ncbi:MAG: 23S rRNA (uracil(1939)-C(5))-methyltransferase RlmD [Firmicutes bacterium]|nr:23S rRNA (uracil(1939)-C(5))-methyltransferase RlmD [Bacillota bacterium]